MRRTKKTQWIIAGILLFGLNISAQNNRHISMNDAVETALRNNSNIKTTELEWKISHANYRQTDAVFLPQIDLGYTALTTNNPLNAFGFLLQQESVTAADFAPEKLNNPGSSQDYSARVEARLPLFNLDMIYARKGAKAQEEAYKHKAQRTKQYIEFEVKKTYTQLQFSYQAKGVLQKTLTDTRQIHQSVNNFYEQGLLQKSDVLNAQVQVNIIETALAKAESNIYNASEALGLLMGTDNNGNVFHTDTLLQNTPAYRQHTISTERPDIVAQMKALDAGNMMVKSAQMAFIPRINAFGSYQFNDDKPFKFGADSYIAGINLSWNIFSGNQTGNKIKSHRLQSYKMQEELNQYIKQSQLELDKAARELNDLQIEIDKQKLSVEQAEEALRILTNRHAEGLVSTTDLLMSQAQLSQQELSLAQAIMAYNIAQAYLLFLAETE